MSQTPPLHLPDHTTAQPQTAWPMVLAWGAAAGCLGRAIQLRDGLYIERGLLWLSVAIMLALVPLALNRRAWRGVHWPRAAVALLAGMMVWGFVQFFSYEMPGSQSSGPKTFHGWPHWKDSTWRFYGMLFAAAGCGVAMSVLAWRGKEQVIRRVLFPIALAAFAGLGVWMIKVVPKPHMDVWWAQRAGLDAFLAGKNPYTSTYPNIYYNEKTDQKVYAPGVLKDDPRVVKQGFPYPPVVFWMDLPGHWLLGDLRYSNLACILAAAALLAYARGGVIGPLAAMVFLFTPRALFVLESGWTEPTSIVLLAGVVFAAARLGHNVPGPSDGPSDPCGAPGPGNPSASRWITPILLGLLLASKQYLIVVAPCALMLLPRKLNGPELARWLALAIGVAAAVSLPLALWDRAAFFHSIVGQAGDSALRTDALSYLAWLKVARGIDPPLWLGFPAALALAALAWWSLPHAPSGFAAAIAMALLLFFALGKFAFCNYYYLIIATLCAAVAAHGAEKDRSTTKDTKSTEENS